jgi:hypothetical protein
VKAAGTRIRKPKERGEWAELRFMAKAAELGFKLSKPWGESAPYDVVIEHGTGFIRVQVKSTMARDRFMRTHYKQNMYAIHARRNSDKPYRVSDFDFLAVYIIPEDLWYIVPASVAVRWKTMRVIPRGKRNRHAQYEEAWHLLREYGKTVPPAINLQDAADPFRFHELTPDWETHGFKGC